jgi:hypothetical protein
MQIFFTVIMAGEVGQAAVEATPRRAVQELEAREDAEAIDALGLAGAYAPAFISRYTTGNPADRTWTSTFYYVMAPWNPYGQVIMRTAVRIPSGSR